MVIAIASGKGGTGKTTVATNLVLSVPNSIYFDCDVEEPDGHLFLNPKIKHTATVGRLIPKIDYKRCTLCRECAQVCEFNALCILPKEILIFDELCHACGACSYFCPTDAISEIEKPMGIIKIGNLNGEKTLFVEGRLSIGEMMASPLIKKVKKYINADKINILDASPGTACAMVETIRGTDFCILVTEPTPFGMHDLKLAVNVMRILGLPFGVIINKCQDDFNTTEEYCRKENIPVLMRIPFDRKLAEAYSIGLPAVNVFPEYKEKFQDLYINIKELILRKSSKIRVS